MILIDLSLEVIQGHVNYCGVYVYLQNMIIKYIY